MRMTQIIEQKRDAEELSKEQIAWFVQEYTSGNIPDYQASAFLMAVYLNGMTQKETFYLTRAMAQSGEHLDLSFIDGPKADKHSSGGVGDKTTLVVAPVVAACGVTMAKMSGRGLGYTGGTIDKLEAVPGLKTGLSLEQILQQLEREGICIAGQTQNLAPADKKLYALRDVTGTVASIPLIASSIMSKKIASGADVLVLDVKVGCGAFMKTLEEAEQLGELMVQLGEAAGIKTCAMLTNMDQPLGRAVGNALEVREAVMMLKGEETEPEFARLCIELSARILVLAQKAEDQEKARALVKQALDSGMAYEKLKACVAAQDGDVAALDNTQRLPGAQYAFKLLADHGGYIAGIQSEQIGSAAHQAGAGRERKEDVIDPGVGIWLHKKCGDYVRSGEVLATLYLNNASKSRNIIQKIKNAYSFSEVPPEQEPLIYRIILKNE